MSRFHQSSIHNVSKCKPKRLAPFSLRLTIEEREELEQLAAGLPLSAYIKERLFDGKTPKSQFNAKRRRRAKVKDYKALARLLAMLGNSRLPQNMNQLAKASHVGNLPLQDDVERDLRRACEDIRAMRIMLMRAMGMKVRDQDEAKAESLSQTFSQAAAGIPDYPHEVYTQKLQP